MSWIGIWYLPNKVQLVAMALAAIPTKPTHKRRPSHCLWVRLFRHFVGSICLLFPCLSDFHAVAILTVLEKTSTIFCLWQCKQNDEQKSWL